VIKFLIAKAGRNRYYIGCLLNQTKSYTYVHFFTIQYIILSDVFEGLHVNNLCSSVVLFPVN